jgi:hypothetical protein
MKKVGMFFICGVAVLSLLFTFSVPAAHAQVGALDDCIGLSKIAGNFKVFDTDTLEKEKGVLKGAVILRNAGANAFSGFDYFINVITETGAGNTCGELSIGILQTRGSSEATAEGFGGLFSSDFPDDLEADTFLFFDFIAKVNADKGNIKSAAAIAGLEVDSSGDTLGYSKASKFQFKKKDFEKVAKKAELLCDDPT